MRVFGTTREHLDKVKFVLDKWDKSMRSSRTRLNKSRGRQKSLRKQMNKSLEMLSKAGRMLR